MSADSVTTNPGGGCMSQKRFEEHLSKQALRLTRLRTLEESAGIRDRVAPVGDALGYYSADVFRPAYFSVENIEIRKSLIFWFREYQQARSTAYFSSQVQDFREEIAELERQLVHLPWKLQTAITCAMVWFGHSFGQLVGALVGAALGSYVMKGAIARHVSNCQESKREASEKLTQVGKNEAEYRADPDNLREVFTHAEEVTGQPSEGWDKPNPPNSDPGPLMKALLAHERDSRQ